jgi:hypothetical protein
MTNGQENRRSFRVNESVYIKYEVLSENEVHEGLDRRKIRLGLNDGAQSMLVDIEARLGEAMYKLSAESEKLGKCITMLNDKVNIVIDQIPGLRKEKSALATLPPQTCDVGADGLVFASDRPMEVGTKLYVQFLLSTDNRYVETFSRVVRVADVPPGNDPHMKYGIAIEFIGMLAAQREILIQHMFTRESETLRMRRLELDAADG